MIALVLLALLLLGAFWLYTPDKARAELEADYLRTPADMVRVKDTLLHVRDDGPVDAPAIIMLHGFGSSLETFEPWASALRRDYRVIRIDLPGSGLSPPDPTGDYSDKRSMALLGALMDQLSLPRATFIGNSIGGRIAWKMGAFHPDRVSKLVLVSPDGFASPGFEYGVAPKVPSMMQAMRYALPKAALKMNLTPSYGNPDTLNDATVTRYHDLMLAPGSREALLTRMGQTVLVDPVPLLRKIKAPVLLIWGEKDAMIPFTNASDYLRLLPNARLASFPKLGHVPQEEGPEETLGALKAFLAE